MATCLRLWLRKLRLKVPRSNLVMINVSESVTDLGSILNRLACLMMMLGSKLDITVIM